MKFEIAEVLLIEEHGELSLAELAELSRLSETELLELVDYEALLPLDPYAREPTFAAHAIVTARTACRLRDDFELDTPGVALVLALLDRIGDLETEIRELMALVPRRMR